MILSAAGVCHGAEPPAAGTREKEVVAAQVWRQETGEEADHLTGDWGGVRQRMVERGIHFSAGYTGEALANLSGGLKEGVAYNGLLELGLDVDFERAGLWQSGEFHISSLYPHGPSLSGRYTGDLLTASNIDAYDSFRLYELWYEHRFLNETFSIRAGQLAADEEFAFTDAGSWFVNSAFGWPAFISGNVVNGGPAYFAAAPGVRLRIEPTEEFFLQAGIFDGDPFDSPEGDPSVNASGTRVHLGSEQGLLAIAEAGWKKDAGGETPGLPGEYKAGTWMHTGNFPSNYEDESGGPFVQSGLEPRSHRRNHGVYVAAEQMVWREEEGTDQGLCLFSRAGVSPRDRNLFEFVYDGGVTYRGLFRDRSEDMWGAGVTYARLSREIRQREREDAQNNTATFDAFSDHEIVVETFYTIQLRKWLLIQPDFQWIHHPGGSGALPDAFVAGIRTTIAF